MYNRLFTLKPGRKLDQIERLLDRHDIPYFTQGGQPVDVLNPSNGPGDIQLVISDTYSRDFFRLIDEDIPSRLLQVDSPSSQANS
ncbi:MAG: hypothetical protein AAFV07_06875 [Bacteroidota bacterium]